MPYSFQLFLGLILFAVSQTSIAQMCDVLIDKAAPGESLQETLTALNNESRSVTVCLQDGITITLKKPLSIERDRLTLRSFPGRNPALLQCINSEETCTQPYLIKILSQKKITLSGLHLRATGSQLVGIIADRSSQLKFEKLTVSISGFKNTGILLQGASSILLRDMRVVMAGLENIGIHARSWTKKIFMHHSQFMTRGSSSPAVVVSSESSIEQMSRMDCRTEGQRSHCIHLNDSEIKSISDSTMTTQGHFSNALNLISNNSIHRIQRTTIQAKGNAAIGINLIENSEIRSLAHVQVHSPGDFSQGIKITNSSIGSIQGVLLSASDRSQSHLSLLTLSRQSSIDSIANTVFRLTTAANNNSPIPEVFISIDTRAQNQNKSNPIGVPEPMSLLFCRQPTSSQAWLHTNDSEHLSRLNQSPELFCP